MKYLLFERAFKSYPVFSVKDIKKRFPDFNSRRLVEWQKKEYIQKVRRGYYSFVEGRKDEDFMYYVANKIWKPSYISMESALAFYDFIPEGVFTTTSVTTRNTATYSTPVGHFDYSSIKPVLFFGYRLIQNRNYTYTVGEPEKIILDFFYSRKLNDHDSIQAMRFNTSQIRESIDMDKLAQYQKVFNSSVLDKRIRLLTKTLNA